MNTPLDLIIMLTLTAGAFFCLGMAIGTWMREVAYQNGYDKGFGAASAMYSDSANRVANVKAFPTLKAIR
jgi:hypothetical protein